MDTVASARFLNFPHRMSLRGANLDGRESVDFQDHLKMDVAEVRTFRVIRSWSMTGSRLVPCADAYPRDVRPHANARGQRVHDLRRVAKIA